MTGFEPGSSCFESDRAVNCATTTALGFQMSGEVEGSVPVGKNSRWKSSWAVVVAQLVASETRRLWFESANFIISIYCQL